MSWILVTGATRGLGLAIAKQLISEKYNVIALGRQMTTDLESAINGSSGLLEFVEFDLSNTSAIHGFVTELCKSHGVPYGLVNNAAIGLDGVLGTQHETDIEQLISVNLTAPIILTKYICRQMMIKRTGRIVNISSIVAETGYNGLSVYAATKAGLIGFTKSLSRELGKVGITVNTVLPGFMSTDMTFELDKSKLASIIRRSPLNRLATLEDVAAMVGFLIGKYGHSITGASFTVDAGNTA
ncbi:MAG: SDR family NAD(P)-dependent oxidoreductase [Legionella sp.]